MSQNLYYGHNDNHLHEAGFAICGLVSVIMSSCGNDVSLYVSVYTLVANNVHHGPHRHKDPTKTHGFWHTPCLGPQNHDVGSLC